MIRATSLDLPRNSDTERPCRRQMGTTGSVPFNVYKSMSAALEISWFEIPFVAKTGERHLSVSSNRPWPYRLWNVDKSRLVSEGVLSYLTDAVLSEGGNWRLDLDTQGIAVHRLVRRAAMTIGMDVVFKD